MKYEVKWVHALNMLPPPPACEPSHSPSSVCPYSLIHTIQEWDSTVAFIDADIYLHFKVDDALDSGDLDMFIDHSVLRHNSDFVTTRLQHCSLNISKIYLTCRFIHNADNLDCNLQKNWKLDHDNRTFQSRWESEYLFIEFKGKPFMIDIVSSLLRNYVNHERFQLESPLQLLQLHWK